MALISPMEAMPAALRKAFEASPTRIR